MSRVNRPSTMRRVLRTTCGLAAWPVAMASTTTGGIEAGALGEREPFGGRRDLHGADEVDGELVRRPGADGAEVQHARRERVEQRPRRFEVGGVGADEQRQLAGGRGRAASPSRARRDSASRARRRERAERRGPTRATPSSTRWRTLRGASSAASAPSAPSHIALRRYVVGRHRDDGVGAVARCARRARERRARATSGSARAARAVVDGEVVARGEQPRRHAGAHAPEPEERDALHRRSIPRGAAAAV